MARVLSVILILLLVALLVFLAFSFLPNPPKSEINNESVPAVFSDEIKSPHWEGSTPPHKAVLAGVPANVVIDFNFDLSNASRIVIIHNDADFGEGETIIDSNKLAMRRNMSINSPDGIYTVQYKACWPDNTCHNGQFQFAINKSLQDSFTDFSGEKQVAINLSGFRIIPENIIIDKGTNVIWTNQDSAIHYINTDSHPTHTFYPAQNSQALNRGDTFSLVFNNPGLYPYHCSTHPESMRGTIIVK